MLHFPLNKSNQFATPIELGQNSLILWLASDCAQCTTGIFEQRCLAFVLLHTLKAKFDAVLGTHITLIAFIDGVLPHGAEGSLSCRFNVHVLFQHNSQRLAHTMLSAKTKVRF